jgi:hypothetical protein
MPNAAPVSSPSGATNLGVPGVAYDPNAERRSFAAMRDFFDALWGAP